MPHDILVSRVPVQGGEKAWATTLALAYLEIALSSLKDDWTLSAEKSKKYLGGVLKMLGEQFTLENWLFDAKSILTGHGVKVL